MRLIFGTDKYKMEQYPNATINEDGKLVPFSLRKLDALHATILPIQILRSKITQKQSCEWMRLQICNSTNTDESNYSPSATTNPIRDNWKFRQVFSCIAFIFIFIYAACAHANQLIHNSRTHFKKRQQRQIMLAKLIGWQTLFHFQHTPQKKKRWKLVSGEFRICGKRNINTNL